MQRFRCVSMWQRSRGVGVGFDFQGSAQFRSRALAFQVGLEAVSWQGKERTEFHLAHRSQNQTVAYICFMKIQAWLVGGRALRFAHRTEVVQPPHSACATLHIILGLGERHEL